MQLIKSLTLFFVCTTLILADKMPDWVESKPVSSSSYIGIGVAVKDQFKSKDEWIKAAESRALGGISEGISVSIDASSKLTQTATNDQIKDLYQENIRTFTKANLEGYQFVESWENKKEYWVYYSLNKGTWQAIEQKRLREAVAKSQSYIDNALSMESSGNIVSAIRGYVQAYSEIIPVLHLDPRLSVNGSSVPAQASIDNRLVSLLNAIIVDMKKPLYSGARSAFGSKEPKISVRTSSAGAGSFPLSIGDQKRFSGNDGSIGIGNAYLSGKEPGPTGELLLPIATDFEQFIPAGNSNPLIRQWLAKQKWPAGSAVFRFTKPAIYIESAEATYSDLPYDELVMAMKSKITEIGYGIASYPDEADLKVVIKSSSRAGGSMGNLYFSYIDMAWSLYDQFGEELVAESLPSIKDGALSYDEASLKAYKKAGTALSTRVSTWIKENRK